MDKYGLFLAWNWVDDCILSFQGKALFIYLFGLTFSNGIWSHWNGFGDSHLPLLIMGKGDLSKENG